jgi:hypothetical protein
MECVTTNCNGSGMIRAFEPSFVTQYQSAFTELVRLGSIAAQKRVDGKESLKEDSIAQRLFIVLQALDSDNLSDKEIDALEYCLISLNESLVTPTISGIVTVSPEPHVSATYRIRIWAGKFNNSLKDTEFSIVGPIIMGFGYGAFSASFQNMLFNRDSNIAVNNGSFSLMMEDISLSHNVYVEPYAISLYLTENIGGVPTWSTDFDNGTSIPTLSVAGNADSDSATLDADGTPNVTVTVYKTSNSGITEGAGDVIFKKNTVTQSTQAFSVSDNLDGTGSNYKQYTYASLSAGDILEVEITEEL